MCSRYEARVTNTASGDNIAHPGVHLWDARSYPKTPECDQSEGLRHTVRVKGASEGLNFREGEKWLEPVVISSGEFVVYEVELDLQKRGMTKDWSFTVWGESGPVTVEIIGKGKDHWPLVHRDDSKLPPHEIEVSAKERQVE